MMYVAIGEKNRDTIISSLQACFIIAHSSEGILFLRIYIYIYIYIYCECSFLKFYRIKVRLF